MIGRGDTANKSSGQFDDLMLKEWGRGNLLLKGGNSDEVGMTRNPATERGEAQSIDGPAELNLDQLPAGTLLRASSAERSPFLLQMQQFHRSLVLVILNDDKVTVGVILNNPSTKGCEVISNRGGSVTIPMRYGGDFSVKGNSPLLWLHCNRILREADVGTPFSDTTKDGIYVCSQEQATDAMSRNIAKAQDFLVVSGVCVWPKLGSSLGSLVQKGSFEMVPKSKVEHAFRILQQQRLLSAETLSMNVQLTRDAWKMASAGEDGPVGRVTDVLTVGIGEGFDEEDDSIVFNSSKKVSDLADDALRKWVATFLLGAPTLA